MMQFSSFRKNILTVTIIVLEVVKLRLKRKINSRSSFQHMPSNSENVFYKTLAEQFSTKKLDIQNRMIETVINNRCYLHAPWIKYLVHLLTNKYISVYFQEILNVVRNT